ncbi:MAG: response regulator [Planctomycetes bacterium]|nr:response regulator [Planctomycetota bacterium]MBI3843510.1 response regulator [Planctomycetota bacterium]
MGPLSLLAAGIILVADYVTPSSLVIPMLYCVPLVLCAWTRSVRFLWGLAAVLVVLIFTMYLVGPRPGAPAVERIALLNQALAAGVTVVVAGLVHAWIVSNRSVGLQELDLARRKQEVESSREEVQRQAAELEHRTDDLRAANAELESQSEELRATNEELERQSEELRVANEELANRERMLEQLLELSRSLTVELSRDETLKKVCETLGLLTGGAAATIVEKRGDDLVVVCHHGFGPQGLESATVPFARSFTSLILSVGQTGYLKDLSLRPDLAVPQKKGGPPLRSILASPLRVHGKCVGAIEVYSHDPKQWDESHVAIIDSLAAQASISLQNAELVAAIEDERRRFETAFRAVPVGMAVVDDPEGREVRQNPAAAAILGLASDENISLFSPAGMRLKRQFHRDEKPVAEHDLPISRALRGEELRGEEFDLLFPGGKHITILVSTATFYDSQGRITGAVFAFLDITNLKVLQRELELRRRAAEEASVRKTRFLAAVSHDIRTPANAINLMAEVIRRAASMPAMAPQIPELAQKLQQNVLSMLDLVGDVLDVARFDSGKIELIDSEFSLNDLIDEECRQLRPLAEEKGLRLEVEVPERTIWIHTDRIKLARVIGNLLGNAIKFTSAGTIVVSALLGPDPDRRVLVRVRDTGIGIAAEHLSHIFDEFAQLRNPERARTKGTGLGLAICKRLTEIMGGSISVESVLNEGTNFTIALPASAVVVRLDTSYRTEHNPSKGDSSDPPVPKLPGMRILVVEDHATSREGTKQILVQEGATILEAPDGATALRLLETERIDVVLLDLMLPDMDGREVLKALETRRPTSVRGVVVSTGDLTEERMAEIKRFGVDALIAKPVDVRKLVASVQTFHREPSPEGREPTLHP